MGRAKVSGLYSDPSDFHLFRKITSVATVVQEWKRKQQEGGCGLILVREENFSVKGQIVK